MKKYGFTFVIVVLLTCAFMLFKFQTWTLLSLIDAITISSLTLIIIGSLLFVVGDGFFSGIAYSFRRFYKNTSKRWQMLRETDGNEEYEQKNHSFSLTVPFLIVGSGLFLLALCVSLFYF